MRLFQPPSKNKNLGNERKGRNMGAHFLLYKNTVCKSNVYA